MDEDVATKSVPSSACCRVWKEKHTKLQQRFMKLEKGRNALREGVALFEHQITKLEKENANCKKAYEEERRRADTEKEERAKESALRISLEEEIRSLKSEIFLLQQIGDSTNGKEEGTKESSLRISMEEEIHALKSEILLLQQKGDSVNEQEDRAKESALRISLEEEIRVLKSEILLLQQKGDFLTQDSNKEVQLLQARVSEGETEIHRLKELVENEKIRSESEKRKAEAERKKANELRKQLKAEKSKADEERRLVSVERKKDEEFRLRLEALKREVDDTRSKLDTANRKLEEASKNIIKEKERANIEKARCEEQRKLAEMNLKKAMDEKCGAENLSQQLEQDRLTTQKYLEELEALLSFRGSPEFLAHGKANESKVCSKSSKFEEVKRRLKEVNQEVIREKNRVYSEMRKIEEQRKIAEEQRKIAEEYEKKAMEEKRHASQLAQLLEVNKRRTEELEKEIQGLVSSRKSVDPPILPPHKNMSVEIGEMKLLRKKLKFEKEQVKHAKQVAKLEIGRNNILREEMRRIKQELVQFSLRLELLDNCISCGDEGINDMAKIGKVSVIQNLKRKFSGEESSQMHLDVENELIKRSCRGSTNMDLSDPLKQTGDGSAPLLLTARGNGTESTSGIDSKLEPLLRGSSKQILETSAINPDRPLVGSQERGVDSVATSSKLAEEVSNQETSVSRLSDEVIDTRYNENLAAVAENSVRSPLTLGAISRRSGHSKRRRRIANVVESLEHLYSKGHKWNKQITEKLSVLHGLLHNGMKKPLEVGKSLVPYLEHNLSSKQDRPHKKRKSSSEERSVMWDLVNSDELKDRLGSEGAEESNICLQISSPGYDVRNAALGSNDKNSVAFRGNMEISEWFDDVVKVDYMKLLDLEDEVDEEAYRTATKVPLSPTLPDLEFESSKLTQPLVDEIPSDGVQNEKDQFTPCCNSDLIDVEFASHLPPLQYNENSTMLNENLSRNETGKSNGGDCDGYNILDSDAELGISAIINSRNEELNILHGGGVEFVHDNNPKYCVVYSDINDHGSICRVHHATRNCMVQFPMVSHADLFVRNILTSLSKFKGLSSREKVCVFFSLLLNNFSGTVAAYNFGSFSDRNFILVLEAFANCMHGVLSDSEMRSMFAELCHLSDMLALIEDFLIVRMVVVYGDDVSLDSGADINFSTEVASSVLLAAGAALLASICTAVDYIGFLCEASYNIFRKHKFETADMLTILHLFVYICGYKYVTSDDYGLVMTVLKSLVTFLEKDNLSLDSRCCFASLAEKWSKPPSGIKCPFSDGAAPLNVVVSLLLERLENHACHNEKTEQYRCHTDNFVGKSWDCEASCCLNEFGMSEVSSDGILCPLIDVLSLLELVACSMPWDWTCDNIVYKLLKLLESSVFENLAAAIVVFLGQLGRFGIDSKGCEDTGVENIRTRLSAFLDQSVSKKSNHHIQITVVTVLLGLLPLAFEQVIKNDLELQADITKSIPARSIKNWFNLLNEEGKYLFSGLLESKKCSVSWNR